MGNFTNKLRGWAYDKANGVWKFMVNDGTERSVFDEGGNLYHKGIKMTPTQSQSVLFTEAGAGTYTGTVSIPAGAMLVDVIVHATALWAAATSAVMIVGDDVDDNGFYDAVNLKATDLLAGESISFAQAGGKGGADVNATHVNRRVLADAREIIGVITSVGAGTTGRTLMTVVYTVPEASAAVKS